MALHPYLSKGFAPLRREFDCADLEIEGRIPAGLSGTFYRIGPSPQFPPREPYNPLLGDGMVHGFTIAKGRASYRNRWIRTKRWQLEHRAGRALFGTSGAPADSDPSVAGIETDGVANTNVVWHAGRFLALEEGSGPIAIDPASLATNGQCAFDGRLPRNMTAHPKIDPVTGEMVLIANFENFRQPLAVGLHVVDASGAIARSTRICGPFPSLIHDFALTADFIVIVFCPVTVSIKRATEGRPLIAWEPELATRIAILRRDSGELRWFEGPSCMTWHVMNAFNDAGRVIVDLCPQEAPMFPFADGRPPDVAQAGQYLTRWAFDWARPGAFEAHRLVEMPCEYPRVDERRTAHPYRHGFLACIGGPGTQDIFQRGIGHYDHARERWTVWHAGSTCAVAEPVFAPMSADTDEGQGFLLTNVYDEARETSHLAILDAGDVASGPVARVHLAHGMPVGFHGSWRASGALGRT
jgi:carotenoid cleavage dioxygenase